MAEESKNEAIIHLLKIFQGPEIPMTNFSIKITFMALQIMRKLIQYSSKAKSMFIESNGAMDAIIKLIRTDNITYINELIEGSAYSFLTQVIREESDYKRILGKRVLSVLNERLIRNNEVLL